MSLIKKAAHLKVCPDCGNHAQIAFADGNLSKHFGTILRGLMILQLARQLEMMTGEEYAYVRKEIYATPFPSVDVSADSRIDRFYNGGDENLENIEVVSLKTNLEKTDLLILSTMFGSRPSDKTVCENGLC